MNKQFDELALIADSLDQRGLHEEAGLVDRFLYKEGAIFSRWEKEAVKAIGDTLNKLKDYSLISTPDQPSEILGLDSQRKKLKGTVAEQYYEISKWLDSFLRQILEPQMKWVKGNEYYETLLEFTTLMKRALEGQHSRLSSVENYHDSLKIGVEALVTALNSLTVNPELEDQELEDIADKLDEIKQEYFVLINPLKEILKKGNINLSNYDGILENFQDNLKEFLSKQSEEGDTLQSFFQDQKVINQKKHVEEKQHSFKWVLENAKQVGAETEKMAEQYKAIAERRREFQKRRLKDYTTLETLSELLKDRYNYWMARYKNEGVNEYNVKSALDKYNGLENMLEQVQFALEIYSPESLIDTVEGSIKRLSKVAESEFGLMPMGENEQTKEIENLAEKVIETKKTLEANSQKWDKAVSASQMLFQKLNSEVANAFTSGRVRKDWDAFHKQNSSLIKQVNKQFDLIEKNNSKVQDYLAPKIDSFNKVIGLLFN